MGASCHTEECRSSEQACLAARGQPVEGRENERYSMNLTARPVTCSEVYGSVCGGLGSTSTSTPCMGKNDEGGMEPCLDAEGHKSHDACMSRAGTMRFDGRMYPAQMEYDPSRTGNSQGFSHMVSEMTRYSSKCCKTGGYKDACLTPQQKDAAYKYHTCANPSQFDPKRRVEAFGDRSCSEPDTISCGKQGYAEG